jgi:hypothetical protein
MTGRVDAASNGDKAKAANEANLHYLYPFEEGAFSDFSR